MEITGKQVLTWTKRVEVMRLQTVMLGSLKEKRDFNAIGSNIRGKPKMIKTKQSRKKSRKGNNSQCKYCGSTHKTRTTPNKVCVECGRMKHIESVCRSAHRQDSRKNNEAAEVGQ